LKRKKKRSLYKTKKRKVGTREKLENGSHGRGEGNSLIYTIEGLRTGVGAWKKLNVLPKKKNTVEIERLGIWGVILIDLAKRPNQKRKP